LHHLHFIDLRKPLQALTDTRQIHAEDIFAFTQIGHFKTSRAARVPSVCSSIVFPIIGFSKKKRLAASRARDKQQRKPGQRHQSGEHSQNPACAMPRSSAGANFYVEQMLLTPLAKIGHALIALSRTSSSDFHLEVPSVLARESSMMRAQRST
jgi:hypothetical protein